jgi:hypothetical protein
MTLKSLFIPFFLQIESIKNGILYFFRIRGSCPATARGRVNCPWEKWATYYGTADQPVENWERYLASPPTRVGFHFTGVSLRFSTGD